MEYIDAEMIMARFGRILKRGSDDEGPHARKDRKAVARKLKEEKPDRSEIGEALEEIEAEDHFAGLGGIEDELIELEGISPPTPPRDLGQVYAHQFTERFTESEEKFRLIENVVVNMKDESEKLQEQFAKIEQDIRKLLSGYDDLAARFKSGADKAMDEPIPPKPPIESIPEGREPAFTPFVEGIGPFIPSGSEGLIELRSDGEFLQLERLDPFAHEDLQFRPFSIEDQFRPGRWDMGEKTDSDLPMKFDRNSPILTKIKHDYLTLVLVMRWIEFLFERTPRDKISLVLDYYKDIGWISEDVKSEIMTYARGEVQDVTKYMADEETRDDTLNGDLAPSFGYKKIDDWRLSADDHLKSLLFITKIANVGVDRDRLNSLELTIQKFKESLESFHGV